jgi:hypothetical protein
MSWRELVNWNPESSTQFTHNTHNSRNGASEINSAYSAYSAVKNPDNGKSIASPIFKTEVVEPASNHNKEDEQLIQSVIDWVGNCEPGEEWQMPQDWLPDSDELREAADSCVRQRQPNLRIWRTGKDRLVCKVWFGAESSPYRLPQKTTRRFRGTDSKRIQTMWSEDKQSWCRWDAVIGDYVAAPELNSES